MAHNHKRNQTGDDLSDLLRSLDLHLRSRNRAAGTIVQYTGELTRFAAWLGVDRLDLSAVTKEQLEGYFAHQFEMQVAPATVLYRYKGLQAVFRWHSRREGYVSPMLAVEPPSVPETQKDIVPLTEIRRVLRSLDRARRYRDGAIVSLLAETGIRVSELRSMDWSSIDWRTSTITLEDTKNGEVRTVPFGPATGERLDLWRTKRSDRSSPIVFAGQRGHRLDRSSIHRIVHRIFADQGIPGIGPHDLRHTMATAYMDANPQGMEDLKVVGGWKSDTMVRRYSKQGAARRGVESFRKNNPLSAI